MQADLPSMLVYQKGSLILAYIIFERILIRARGRRGRRGTRLSSQPLFPLHLARRPLNEADRMRVAWIGRR